MSQKIPALEQVIGLTLLGLMAADGDGDGDGNEDEDEDEDDDGVLAWWRVDEASSVVGCQPMIALVADELAETRTGGSCLAGREFSPKSHTL
ncbi:hypothetical protein ACLKA6_010956 [Drosophila palustris]